MISVTVLKEYDIPGARAAARRLGEAAALNHRKCFQLMTAVSELANKRCFHTTHGGTISLAVVTLRDILGVEVVAEDNGPDIPDIAMAMTDGFSTNGGLGGGLPGERRLMDEFEIASIVDKGTRVVTRIWNR